MMTDISIETTTDVLGKELAHNNDDEPKRFVFLSVNAFNNNNSIHNVPLGVFDNQTLLEQEKQRAETYLKKYYTSIEFETIDIVINQPIWP